MRAPRPPVTRRLSMWGSRLGSDEVPIVLKVPPSLGVRAAVAAGAAPAARVGEAAAALVGTGAVVAVSVLAVQPARATPARPSAAPRRTRRREARRAVQ